MTKRLNEGNNKEDVKEPVMNQIEKGHEEFEEAKKHKAAVEEDYKMDGLWFESKWFKIRNENQKEESTIHEFTK